ncbi:conserved hypothetical protein [delta proteobacterium NaphS2]|nr:conserved hypothetical protein [delta proteobacterium NaphS2]
MKKLFFLIILAACVYGIFNYHFILMDSSLKILKKTHMTLDDTFVDARGSNKKELLLNPALLKAGARDLVAQDSVTIGK